MNSTIKKVVVCSFCSKDSNDKDLLHFVRSSKNPEIYICNECIKLAKELAKKTKGRQL